MKIDFSAALTDINGKPFADKATVKIVCINALLEDDQVPGTEKLKRFKLADKINATEDELEVTAEEVVLLKDLIAKLFGPLVVGRVYEVLG